MSTWSNVNKVAAPRKFNDGGFGGGNFQRFNNYDDRNYNDNSGWQDEYSGGGGGRGRFPNRFAGNSRENVRGGRGGFRGGRGNFTPNRFRQDFDGGFRNRGGDGGFEKGGYTTELMCKSIYIQSKKFFIDVKENKRGKFVKIAEVAPNGQKMKLVMDLSTTAEFHEKLTDICEVYAALRPTKDQRGFEQEAKIHSESIFKADKRYYLDLKENHRGRFLKVSMTMNTERSQIVIPAHGMVDIRDVLTDILSTFGKEDPKPTVSKAEKERIIEFEDKTFTLDIGTNARGKYMRITETCGDFKASVTVGDNSWNEFCTLVEEAMDTPVPETPTKEEVTPDVAAV